MAGLATAEQIALSGEPDRTAPAHLRHADPLERRLHLLVASGGDERIWHDPATGRTRYATTLTPAPDELWFSSSTASAISERGYRAALADLHALFGRGRRMPLPVEDWVGALKAELLVLFGRPRAEAVLAASGTDAELVALAITERLLRRPITNIVVAPNETGSGVCKAAGGRHFLSTSCLGGPAAIGAPLDGWEKADIEVAGVDIRTGAGEPRDPRAVDAEVAHLAERALARGRGVLLHVLDTSKTGLAGLSRDIASQIAASAPDRVLVMVDACQLRCPADRLRTDIDRGFMVLVTGSKFAGGPPLCGALLLPSSIVAALQSATPAPRGLADYSARLDWPEALQATFAAPMTTTSNLGAGLRWSAALAELRQLAAVRPGVHAQVLACFAEEVRTAASTVPRIALLADRAHGFAPHPTIVPFAITRGDGTFMSAAEMAGAQAALRTPLDGPPAARERIHVGQAVQLGPRAVLRVCASAPHVNAVADRMAGGASFETAFAPLRGDIHALFAKLAHMLAGD
ncbi:MAG TPA: hypothetical protein VJ740_05225 [Hyphomicrobiaceae bacterium]|nr:hypothetical protein [Hyphomicrobiaceae bacterium]